MIKLNILNHDTMQITFFAVSSTAVCNRRRCRIRYCPCLTQFKAIRKESTQATSDRSCTADLPGVLLASFTNRNQSSHTQETTKPTRQGSSNWQRMTHVVALHDRQATHMRACSCSVRPLLLPLLHVRLLGGCSAGWLAGQPPHESLFT